MSLRTDTYNKIIAEYDSLRAENEIKRKARYAEICEKTPELLKIDKEIENLGIKSVKESIINPKNAKEIAANLDKQIAELIAIKKDIISSSGYEKYLEVPFICPDCKDTGFIGSEKCHCLTNKILSANYDMSNIKNILAVENFSTFSADLYSDDVDEDFGVSPKENILNIRDSALDFCATFPNGKNLMFFGEPGLGKTFLCNCIAKEVLDNSHTVMYITAWQLFKKIADATFRCDDDDEAYNDILSDIMTCELLIIDDLGSELVNAFTASEFFNIINQRLTNNLSVILSTNHSLDELTEKYSERVVSRIIGDYEIFSFFGEDLRLKKHMD